MELCGWNGVGGWMEMEGCNGGWKMDVDRDGTGWNGEQASDRISQFRAGFFSRLGVLKTNFYFQLVLIENWNNIIDYSL